MPGKEDEGEEIVKWLANNVSKDLYVHIMEQYHPDAHVGKGKRGGKSTDPGGAPNNENVRYSEINRAVSLDEVKGVRQAAVRAGLWRFCEAAEHGGFNI